MATAARLTAVVEDLLKEGKANVALDLSSVVFFDSTALHALWRAARALQDAHGSLTLSAVSRPVRNVLQLTGVDQLLPIPGRED